MSNINLYIGKKSVALTKYYSLLLLIFEHVGTNIKMVCYVQSY